MTLANILGPDLGIVAVVLLFLFGGSQLPKLARSLGSASHEFRKGTEEGTTAGTPAVELSSNHSTPSATVVS